MIKQHADDKDESFRLQEYLDIWLVGQIRQIEFNPVQSEVLHLGRGNNARVFMINDMIMSHQWKRMFLDLYVHRYLKKTDELDG